MAILGNIPIHTIRHMEGSRYYIRTISMSDYDIVIDTLEKQRYILMKMTESNINHNLFNIMDQIRLEQIDQINKAIEMWKDYHRPESIHSCDIEGCAVCDPTYGL